MPLHHNATNIFVHALQKILKHGLQVTCGYH